MKLVSTSPFAEACREAYRKSPAYRALNEAEPVPGTVAAALPKKTVEYRPDMPVEDYERWIEEQASP